MSHPISLLHLRAFARERGLMCFPQHEFRGDGRHCFLIIAEEDQQHGWETLAAVEYGKKAGLSAGDARETARRIIADLSTKRAGAKA